MSSTAILAVGLDSPETDADRRTWQSAGYFVTWANSIREAMGWIPVSDFDLVLLSDSIPLESRERLAFLVRASGASTPVVSIVDSSIKDKSIAQPEIADKPKELSKRIDQLLAYCTPSPIAKIG